jgi:hypothetical protein
MANPVLIAQAVAVGIDALLKIYEAVKDDKEIPEPEREGLRQRIRGLIDKIKD